VTATPATVEHLDPEGLEHVEWAARLAMPGDRPRRRQAGR
jgi:hypothetical protein